MSETVGTSKKEAEMKATRYSFVSIPLHRQREGFILDRDYREVIRERGLAGWKFVQAITCETHTDPRLDLVFSRKEKIT